MGVVLRYIAVVCVLLLLVQPGDASNDPFLWGRRRRRKAVMAASRVCRKCHVVSLSDAHDAAIASAHVYNAKTPVNSQIGNTGYKIIKVITHANPDLKAYVADKGNTRMVVFRGTNGASQLMEQVIRGLQNADGTEDHSVEINKIPVKVLTFTWDGNQGLMKDILPLVKDSSKKYILTGHSLGGALASLFGLVAKFEPDTKLFSNKDSCILTFGAPRMGNKAFADLHDKEILPERKIRFVYKRDLAAHVPVTVPGKATFIHHSREVWIGTQYLLDRSWTNFFNPSTRATTAWRVCKDQDTHDCSNGLPWSYLVTDHDIKNYIWALKKENIPKTFEDKNMKTHKSWPETWMCSNAS